MKMIYSALSTLLIFSLSCCAQEKYTDVGGNCEICGGIYESPVPFEKLNSTDTLPDFNNEGPRLKVEGIVYKKDKRAPAKDVVLYIYHTDQSGIYPRKGDEKGYATRHGYLRGWIKTDGNGRYSFYTLRPASYPDSKAPAHIHAVVKEPDKNAYWIDEFLFNDDPFLKDEKTHLQNRGGSGVLTLKKIDNNYFSAKRDIILGENIPNYP